MIYFGLLALGLGLGLGIAAIGSGIGQGIASNGALQGMARQPEAIPKIQTAMILALVFPETLVIFTLVFLFLLKGSMPADPAAVLTAIQAGAK